MIATGLDLYSSCHHKIQRHGCPKRVLCNTMESVGLLAFLCPSVSNWDHQSNHFQSSGTPYHCNWKLSNCCGIVAYTLDLDFLLYCQSQATGAGVENDFARSPTRATDSVAWTGYYWKHFCWDRLWDLSTIDGNI